MKLTKKSNYVGFERAKAEDYIKDVDHDLRNLFVSLNGRVRFGTGVDGINGENLAGQFQVFTTDATPDTEGAVAHTIGSVPVGYMVLSQDKAGSLYKSGTAWTASNVYFKSDVASVAFTVFLIK